MSVLVLTDEDLRRILREELRAFLGELPARAQEDRRVTYAEAAAAAGVSAATIRSWVDAGRLHKYGQGRGIRFSLAEVRAIAPREQAPALSIHEHADAILRRKSNG